MTLTARDILDIGPADTAKLFAGTPDQIKAAYRAMAKQWHPDHNSDPMAAAVLQHLTALRSRALSGTAGPATQERVFRADGKAWRLRYLKTRPFDGGEIFVGHHTVAYRIDPANSDLARAALAFTPRFEDGRMKVEMERLLPLPVKQAETDEGWVFVYRRTADQVLMADLLAHLGTIDPRHVAWMISAMENLACYLGWAGFAHGSLDLDCLLVSPLYHSVAITGPMLYRTEFGKRPVALPSRTLDVVPRMALAGVPVDGLLDLELVRLTARELLGDLAGSRLLGRADVPKEVALWLMTPPAGSGAAEDYGSWARARAGFGERKFLEMKVSADAVYAA